MGEKDQAEDLALSKLETLSLDKALTQQKVLREYLTALDARITTLKVADKQARIEKAKEYLDQCGLKPRDLIEATSKAKPKSAKGGGGTLPPKYLDPANPSNTWAGRGNSPKWLKAYEAQGRKREEFLIKNGGS